MGIVLTECFFPNKICTDFHFLMSVTAHAYYVTFYRAQYRVPKKWRSLCRFCLPEWLLFKLISVFEQKYFSGFYVFYQDLCTHLFILIDERNKSLKFMGLLFFLYSWFVNAFYVTIIANKFKSVRPVSFEKRIWNFIST